jgi:hypothetical protein
MPNSNGPQNNEDDNRSPEEEMRRMLEQMLGGGGIDSDKLAGAAGLPADPQALAHMLMQLQQAMQNPTDGVDWNLVRDAARRAATPNEEVDDEDARAYDRAFQVAGLWLGDAMGESFGAFSGIPQTITRYEWLELTLDGWAELTNPVATSISNALVEVLAEQAPEEMKDMVARSGPIVRSLGQSMFAMQLGQVLGQLAKEVLSGGDIGMPVLPDHKAALLPQNLQEWSTATRCSSTWRCASSRTHSCSRTRAGCDCTSCRRSPSLPAASASTPIASRRRFASSTCRTLRRFSSCSSRAS